MGEDSSNIPNHNWKNKMETKIHWNEKKFNKNKEQKQDVKKGSPTQILPTKKLF